MGLAEDHPLAGKDVVDLADCAEETFVLVSRTASAQSPLTKASPASAKATALLPQVIEEGSTPAARFGDGVRRRRCDDSSRVEHQSPLAGRCVPALAPNGTSKLSLAFAYRATNESAALLSFKETLEELLPDTVAPLPVAADGT